MHTEITIEDERWAADALIGDAIRRAIAMACGHAGLNTGPDGEVSILLGGDDRLRALNKAYRGQDKATNVLSFPALRTMGGTSWGDIALAYDTIAREAREQDKTFTDHTLHLAVHGLLHLFGYDHENDGDADTMERLETDILARLGIADPYAALEHMTTQTLSTK